MARTYQLTQENMAGAKSAGMSSAIAEKGAYKGRFTKAEAVTSSNNTEGIEFAFKSDAGQTADYLTVWTYKSDGTELSGAKLVTAIMACVSARTCTPTRASIKKWNNDLRAEEHVDGIVYPELMNKPVGLLIVLEEYENGNGDLKSKPTIVMPFDAATDRTPREKLEQVAQGTDLAGCIERLADKPLKQRTTRPAAGGATHGQQRAAQRNAAMGGGGKSNTGFDNMDDDIPF